MEMSCCGVGVADSAEQGKGAARWGEEEGGREGGGKEGRRRRRKGGGGKEMAELKRGGAGLGGGIYAERCPPNPEKAELLALGFATEMIVKNQKLKMKTDFNREFRSNLFRSKLWSQDSFSVT